jgi:hypothetical protein
MLNKGEAPPPVDMGQYKCFVDHGRPGGDKSIEVTAEIVGDGMVKIISIRELPQEGESPGGIK